MATTGFQRQTFNDWWKSNPYWSKQTNMSDLVGAYEKDQSINEMIWRSNNPAQPTKYTASPIEFPDPNKYFDPSKINALYQLLGSNLYQAQNRNAAAAQRTAAATSGGYLNPGAFITGAGSQVRSSYAPVFGQLKAQQGQSILDNNRALVQALMARSEFQEKAREFDVSTELSREQLDLRRSEILRNYLLALQQMAFQREANQANFLDYFTPFLQAGATVGAAALSDRRLKSNIQRVGTHPLGIGIYSYTIFGSPAIGVMADEVERVKPEAVSTGADGYKRVNYALLR